MTPRVRHIARHGLPAVMLGVATLVVMWFMSFDSPTHNITGHLDSAWYMMCGRAWAHGMTPYVDFTDSKGPLLWLIYAAGHLLTPTSYHGVWVLHWLAMWLACTVLYRCALFFIAGRRTALCAMLPMIAMFFHIYHGENHAEDWAQPFFAIALCCTCGVLYAGKRATRAAAAIGACVAALALIKFTLALMAAGCLLFVGREAARGGARRLGRAALASLLGMAAVLLPMLALLAATGSVGALWREYVVTTIHITSGTTTGLVVVGSRRVLVFFVAALLLVAPLLPRHRWFPLLLFLWFYEVTIQHAFWLYYYNSCMIFLFFPLVAVALLAQRLPFTMRRRHHVAVAATLLVALALYGWHYGPQHPSFKTTAPSRLAACERFSRAMAVEPHPTLVYLDGHCLPPAGDAVQALPGCKNWAQQNGTTAAMRQRQHRDVARLRPRFVMVASDRADLRQWLETLDYVPVCQEDKYYHRTLYAARAPREAKKSQ